MGKNFKKHLSSCTLKAYQFMLILSILVCAPFLVFHGFFDGFTTIKWVAVLFSFNLLLFLFLGRAKYVHIPSVSREVYYILGALAVTLLFNSFYHNVPLFSYENIRRFLFWGAALFFFNFFHKSGERYFPVIEKGICFSLGVFVSVALICKALGVDIPFYLTFGNANIAAEFVAVFFVFPLSMLVRRWDNLKTSWLLNFLVAGSIAYLYFSHCRSIYICLIGLGIMLICVKRCPIKEILKIGCFGALIIFAVENFIFILSYFYPNGGCASSFNLPSLRAASKPFSIRWILYMGTFTMILKNPLGVGVGQFEFASLPYLSAVPEQNENIIFLTPHNEFLHSLAEDGVIFCLLFLILCGSLIYRGYPSLKNIFSRYPEFQFLVIVFGVESLFQAPFVEPLCYFVAAMMIGRLFSLMKRPPITYKLTSVVRFSLMGMNGVIFTLLCAYFTSQYMSTNYPYNETLNKRACSPFSRDWLACLNLASLYLGRSDFKNAEMYATRTLEWQPLNYHGIKMLGLLYFIQGNKKESCRLFQHYDSFFQNQSSLHKIREEGCF